MANIEGMPEIEEVLEWGQGATREECMERMRPYGSLIRASEAELEMIGLGARLVALFYRMTCAARSGIFPEDARDRYTNVLQIVLEGGAWKLKSTAELPLTQK